MDWTLNTHVEYADNPNPAFPWEVWAGGALVAVAKTCIVGWAIADEFQVTAVEIERWENYADYLLQQGGDDLYGVGGYVSLEAMCDVISDYLLVSPLKRERLELVIRDLLDEEGLLEPDWEGIAQGEVERQETFFDNNNL